MGSKPKLSIFGKDDSVPVIGEDIFGYKQDNSPVGYSNVFGYTPEELDSFRKTEKLEEKAAGIIPNTSVIRNDSNLEWERDSYNKKNGNHKRLFTYDNSLERGRQINPNNRHPYSHEFFSLMIRYLQGGFSDNDSIVFLDTLHNPGEWLNQAFLRESEKRLIVYYDPNLIFFGGRYVADGRLKYSKMEVFDVYGIYSGHFAKLNQFEPEFVKAIYSMEFGKLPQVMKEGAREACVFLPPVGTIWPLGRGDYMLNYFGVGCNHNSRASRWVREKIP